LIHFYKRYPRFVALRDETAVLFKSDISFNHTFRDTGFTNKPVGKTLNRHGPDQVNQRVPVPRQPSSQEVLSQS